jgi:hypothetical protein
MVMLDLTARAVVNSARASARWHPRERRVAVERWLHFFGQISLRDKWFGLSD